jgi:hypothetical protein
MPDPTNTIQAGLPNYFAMDYFTYGVSFAALAPAGTATGTFNIEADSDFLWSKAAFQADIAAAAFTASAQPVPNVTVLITDTGAGRQLMNVAVPLATLFGTGQLPFILPRQRRFASRSTVNVSLTNYDAAVTYNVRLSFIGQKAFY